ncbi:hypothetical protein MKEN_00223000 [Mycena kentingensis (nom. inval.)]|nr:hypothetical protein MKEN_00223000 [Mycena kentingensis (nom. inval.)]
MTLQLSPLPMPFSDFPQRTLPQITLNGLSSIISLVYLTVHPNVTLSSSSADSKAENEISVPTTWIARVGRRGVGPKFRLFLVALVAPEVILGFAIRQHSMVSWWMQEHSLPRSTAWFLVMGGFVNEDGRAILTQSAAIRYMDAIKRVDPRTIRDKSKRAGLAILFVGGQVLWFSVQCIARASEGMPFAELEVAAVAFLAVQLCTVIVWSKKPKDVAEPITLVCDTLPTCERPVPHTRSTGDILGHFLTAVIFGVYKHPQSLQEAPLFWSHAHNEPSGNTLGALFWQFIMALVFGGIHALAWTTSFPSAVEMWLCRGSVIFLLVLPVVGLVLAVIYSLLGNGRVRTTLVTINHGAAVIYVAVRVVLLVLPFTTLRGLPPGAFLQSNTVVLQLLPHF